MALFSTIVVGAVAFALSAPSAPMAQPAVAASAATTDEKVFVKTFDLDSSQLKYLGTDAPCPEDAPYLNSHEYHPNSGYLIPRGVSLEGDLGEPVLVNLLGKTQVSGGTSRLVGLLGIGSIHNLSRQSPRYIQVYIHCTDRR